MSGTEGLEEEGPVQAGAICQLVLPTLRAQQGNLLGVVFRHICSRTQESLMEQAGGHAGAFACLTSSWVVLVQGSHLEALLASLEGCHS